MDTHLCKLYRQSGFSIIELMIVVGIAGALTAIALPNFSTMISNNCMTARANTMVASFQLARSISIKRRINADVRARSNVASNEWGAGWQVWQVTPEDINNNGALDAGEDTNGNGFLDSNDIVVRNVDADCEATTMDETANDTSFTYRPTGFIDGPGTIEICDSSRTGEVGRRVIISPTGQIRTERFNGCT